MSLSQQRVDQLNQFLLKIAHEKHIAYEIYELHRCLVYYCPMGLSLDKQHWIQRKRNSVLRFNQSTHQLSIKNNSDENKFFCKYGLNPMDYTLTPGSVPIQDDNGYLLGVITITGLSAQEDHEIALEALSLLK